MITKVSPKRGSRTRGLLEYLWGPGRHNEHTNPHMVAAWDESFLQQELDSFERGLLAREMEAPLRLFGRESGGHVYHVSVSIDAPDGELTDEQWAEVARAGAEKLGFTDADGQAAVPWIAMRHGKSTNGNDHIHFVASLCRENGTVPDIRGDYGKWREVREHFAAKWGLRTGRSRGAGMPGVTRAELESAQRQGRNEPARTELAREVRGAAAGARTEAEFLQRLRRSGVLVSARWEDGKELPVGYSVALKPPTGEKPVWFGGAKLAEDLSLGALRTAWPEPGSEQVADDRREWHPTGWRDMPTGRQLANRRLRAEAWEETGQRIAEMRTRLEQIQPTDAATWSSASREAAGVLAALAHRVEPGHRHQLSRAADALASAAQTADEEPVPPRVDVLAPMAGVARAVADAALVSHSAPIAIATVTMQLGRLVQALERAHELAGRREQAERTARAAEQMLEHIRRTPSPQQLQAQREQQERERQEREVRERQERERRGEQPRGVDQDRGRDGGHGR
ncbi:relaxase/mobilization nuclease domain-containing protein [Saccharopolyspora sp. NPDC049357]|uniref:relaxase/mobilization nuclease domain-containing protein n=1 Tax=Saccharopolyspora sp. NPDC049357 TaxID=3154507 RepID=UPI00343086D8